MMKRCICLLVVLALVTGVGCTSSGANTHTTSGAKKGAIWGALLGAATAVVTGGDAEDVLRNAAIGAAAGAAVGAAVGAAKDRKVAERNAAVEQYAYDSSQGHMLKIERIGISDTSPSPGQEMIVTVRYTAISPNENESIKVSGTPFIKTGEDAIKLGSFSSTVPNGGGTMEVEIPITLDSGMPNGSYTLETQLSVPGSKALSIGRTNFYVG